MKFALTLFALSLVVFSANTPENVRGEITDLYCGDLSQYVADKTGYVQSDENTRKPIGGRCVFFVTGPNDTKFGIISSTNSWVRWAVPSGESHGIVVGRTASFRSCEDIETKHREDIEKSQMPEDVTYLDCYESYTELEIPTDVMITAQDVSGEYSNRRGDKATVTVQIISEGDLFLSPTYEVSIEYQKAGEQEAYIHFDSDSLSWFNNATRPYFQAEYADDCDDPDCYNTDGLIKFLRNRDGSYTMYLQFEHYNNAPIEEDDSFDFSESVYLKKVKDLPVDRSNLGVGSGSI